MVLICVLEISYKVWYLTKPYVILELDCRKIICGKILKDVT